jgi:hypothetical protein
MMNINRAVSVLAKKFAVNADTFKSLSKSTVIAWGEAVATATEQEKRTDTVNLYKLTQPQHAFLIGEIKEF